MRYYTLVLTQQPGVDVGIDIAEGTSAWWTNPIWIAGGIIALVVLVLIIAMAARGHGVTVVKG